VVSEWTNDRAIAQWGAMPRTLLEQTARDGDFAKRHLLNPVLLRLLGDLPGQRVLDAGCGNGYLSRMLASRGAQVTGVEPGQSLFGFAAEQEAVAPRGIRYVQADLCALPDLGAPFDAVVASMVLPAIPDWAGAMAACVQALKPGGLFVFTVNHPCFEQLWRPRGHRRLRAPAQLPHRRRPPGILTAGPGHCAPVTPECSTRGPAAGRGTDMNW
jgi:2-polyprenyl-3-methyl-5-hydroxy-6-metoxy-1,4-benzoquinol methylase